MQSYDPFRKRETKPVTRKEEYEKEYADSKLHGKSFFPDIIFKDTVAALLVFLVIVALAIFRGAPLEAQADPTNTAYAPRPEWYFLFLFEALKYFPGSLEWVAALGIPLIGIGVLVLLPFLDRSRWRHAVNRPIVVSVGLLVVAGMVYLTYASATAPTIVGAASGDAGGNLLPIQRSGRQVFQDRRC
ncbi:MAG: cytochrome B, partial [Dehalococcoidia bacterium]|nr:cytochrome B [Dehalococcoidia bacterium]